MADDNVRDIFTGRPARPGEPPPMDPYEKRFQAIEKELTVISTKMDSFATKADLSDMKASVIQWMVGTLIAGVGVTAAIAFGIARILS